MHLARAHTHTHTRIQTHTLTHTGTSGGGGDLKKRLGEKRKVFHGRFEGTDSGCVTDSSGDWFHVVGALYEK